MKSPCMVKFLAVALFLCAGTLSATAFSKSGGGKNTTAAQKTEGSQADEGAPIYAFGFQRPYIPEDALKGTLFDLMSFRPQKKDEKDKDYKEKSIKYMDEDERKDRLIAAIKTLSSSWDIKDRSWQAKSANPNHNYPQSDTPLFATNIFYHNFNNTGSFFKDEKGVGYPPNCWLCFYEGEFGVPAEGEYRFVGDARTVMLVGVDANDKGKVVGKMKTVLYAFEPKRGFGNNKIVLHLEGWEPTYAEAETNGSNLFKGTWLHLIPGERYPIKIAIGYCSSHGGNLSPYAYLGVQREDLEQVHSDTDDNFPLFTLEKVSSKRPERSLSQPKEGEPKKGQYNSSCGFAPPQK